jgi:hypothetical protein
MKKRKWSLIGLLVVCASLIVVPASSARENCGLEGCTPPKGCTPGYWKQPQHFESWTGYAPSDSFAAVFGTGPNIPLLAALEQGVGGESAFMRHAVAALLNATHPDICYAGWYGNEYMIKWFVQETYRTGEFEYKKDMLEEFNEAGCPLE